MRHRLSPSVSPLALLALLAPISIPAAAAGQEVVITLTDASTVEGVITAIAGRGREANFRIEVEGGSRNVALARVLAVHGPAPEMSAGAVVHLVGGDQLRGEMRGGDAQGETFTLQSRSLGELRWPVDRLEAVVFPDGSEAGLDQFRIPEGASSDEAVFRKARRGYDTILGAIHRFTSRGVLFEWAEESQPELFRYDRLAAVALRGGVPRASPAAAQLVTRTGDVVSAGLVGFEAGRLVFTLEGEGTVSLPVAEVSALTFLGPDRRFLSDLQPTVVEERGTPFEEAATPLYPFRADRAAAGGFLVVGGRTYGKGLGTHSRCSLTFEVPAGFRAFHARVGVDDGVLETPVRGVAEVSVLVGDEIVWGPETVKGGQPPLNLGLVKVEAGQRLTLRADFGDGWFLGDRVDWLGAVLLH